MTRAAKKGDRKTIEHLYSNSLSTNTGWIARSRSYWDELFTNERLHVLVANGGWDPASPDAHPEPVTDATHEPTSDTSDTSDPEGPAS